MEKTSKFNELIAPVIVLVCICLIASFLLAGANMITSPVIAQRAEEAASAARIEVLPEAAGSTFSKVETTLVEGVSEVYKADNGAGYAMTVAYAGFGGPVKMMIGINSNCVTTGLSVLEQSETPGIGSNAMTPEFLQRLIGISSLAGPLGSEGESVDMLGGATYTSKAVFSDVEAAFMQYGVINGASYEPPVELTEEQKIEAAFINVLPQGDSFGIINCDLADNVITVYKAANESGYVVYAQGQGFAGVIKALVGLDSNGAVTGIEVIDHGETPGIGTNAMEADYLANYAGQSQSASVSAVSGATYTSNGIKALVNAALAQFTKL